MLGTTNKRKPRVLVGMSGGVDSSLAAALLIEAGFDVCGAYMKNWILDVPGMRCPWADDMAFAKRTAVRLGIDFRVYDFQEAYKREVVDYLVDEYRLGRTPNPDVMCNQEVKFGLFLDAALEDGFDFVATGHYAKTDWWELYTAESPEQNPAARAYSSRDLSELCPAEHGKLLRCADEAKDQTYFLYRMSQRAVNHTLFPLANFTKPQVREMAAARDLPSAAKADSQGICFVGEAGIRDFLGMYVQRKPGPTIDFDTKEVLGYHDGAIFFTVGQRKGLGIGGGTEPYYVVGKDMENNIVYVSTNPNRIDLQENQLRIGRLSWINEEAPSEGSCQARLRHTGELLAANLSFPEEGVALLDFDQPRKKTASGQSVVLYRGLECLGGGIAL